MTTQDVLSTLKDISGGGVALLFLYCLVTGKGIALMREVTQRDQTIALQATTIEEQGKQITMLLREQGPAVNQFMSSVKQVAEAKSP